MFKLIFKEKFERSFSKLDKPLKIQVWDKIQQLKMAAPLGKRLIGNSYWSLHIGKYRVIYILHHHTQEVEIIDLWERKHDYRELRNF